MGGPLVAILPPIGSPTSGDHLFAEPVDRESQAFGTGLDDPLAATVIAVQELLTTDGCSAQSVECAVRVGLGATFRGQISRRVVRKRRDSRQMRVSLAHDSRWDPDSADRGVLAKLEHEPGIEPSLWATGRVASQHDESSEWARR